MASETISAIAEELNQSIRSGNTGVFEMLSVLGRRAFLPKGILVQGAEAGEKAKKYNATIGIATENRTPMGLASVTKHFSGITSSESLTYAPPTGRMDLRMKWKEGLAAKNPLLGGKRYSLPIVTNGVTHALSLLGDLFVDRGDTVIVTDKYWENYNLVFNVCRGAKIRTFPTFTKTGGFNVAGLEKALERASLKGKAFVILNFPNNPTGYAPTKDEAQAIGRILIAAAENGTKVISVCDDAYFGLFYEPDVFEQSLFALVADAHPNLLAVKVDGPTKELYVWGFRTGFVTFSTKVAADGNAFYAAMEKKFAGQIRANISNCSHPSQSIVLKAMQDPNFGAECAQKKEILKARALKVKEILGRGVGKRFWVPYPFNSGYFMCVRLKKIEGEKFRKHLLDQHGVGVIADGTSDIRIAFSSVELENLEDLFGILEKAAGELS